MKYEIKRMWIEIENQTTTRIIIYFSCYEREKKEKTTNTMGKKW